MLNSLSNQDDIVVVNGSLGLGTSKSFTQRRSTLLDSKVGLNDHALQCNKVLSQN